MRPQEEGGEGRARVVGWRGLTGTKTAKNLLAFKPPKKLIIAMLLYRYQPYYSAFGIIITISSLGVIS